MATRVDLLEPFAAAIYAKAKALRRLNLKPTERARLLESVSDDIKKCTNFSARQVSRAARDLAEKLGVDLRTMNWHDQPRFDKGRKVFHFEHMVPVSTIRGLCLDAGSKRSILAILSTRARCVWILKDEDRELTRLGYRSKRAHPEDAYRQARICIAPKP